LRQGMSGWTAEKWMTVFEQRVGAIEHDGRLPRELAEAEAFKACVAIWLNRNPVMSPAGRCIVCGRGDHPDDVVLPYGTTPPGAAWLHGACWPTWSRERQAQATDALAAMGIRLQANFNPGARSTSNGPEAPPPRTVATEADGGGRGNAPTVRANPLKTNAGTAADGADANCPPKSAPEEAGAAGRRVRP
jgi:hypothetical protein